MANLTQTITESVNLFGGAPANLWNQGNWNAFKFGEGTNAMLASIGGYVLETLASADTIPNLNSTTLISESVSPTSNNSSETLTDGHGYYYVFPSDVTNHENQSLASYTAGTAPGNTWTSASAGSSNWS